MVNPTDIAGNRRRMVNPRDTAGNTEEEETCRGASREIHSSLSYSSLPSAKPESALCSHQSWDSSLKNTTLAEKTKTVITLKD